MSLQAEKYRSVTSFMSNAKLFFTGQLYIINMIALDLIYYIILYQKCIVKIIAVEFGANLKARFKKRYKICERLHSEKVKLANL